MNLLELEKLVYLINKSMLVTMIAGIIEYLVCHIYSVKLSDVMFY